jgi:regulator of sigma E protease
VKWMFPDRIATTDERVKAAEGIEIGDKLTSIDGRKIETGEDLLKAAAGARGRKVNVVVSRDGESKAIAANAARAPAEGGSYLVIGLLGFRPAPHLVKAGFAESITEGLRRIAGMLGIVAKTLTSKRIAEEVGGPVLIWKVTQSYVALGTNYVLGLLGSLSLGLAIINLIPIPAVLDGGHLILLGIEAVRRKRWSRAQMQAMQMVGFAVVIVLIALILAADITKIATGQVPQ